MNEDTVEKKGQGAKDVSLKSMVVAAVWIGLLTLAKMLWTLFCEKAFGLTMNEIIVSGVVIAAVFSPVYFSILMDKIRDIKIGG